MKAVQQVLALAEGFDLFRNEHEQPYATVSVDGSSENWPIAGEEFAQFLARAHYLKTGEPVARHAVRDAQKILAAKAQFDGAQYRTYIRIGELHDRLYLDLANENRQVVEIDQHGWRVLPESPIRFRRPKSMGPLPEPQHGGDLNELRPFLNSPDVDAWQLASVFMLAALRPHGAYPVLQLTGEQGCTKSTTARIIASLIDPKDADLRAQPNSVRDLMITAQHAWLLSFDNLSWIPAWLSDALCRLSTGGGFAARELYSDNQQVLFEAQRPVILNGIADLATRGDLLDRSIVIELPNISPECRRTEFELWREFEIERPRILGALLDAAAGAQKHLRTTILTQHPRMADFALLGTAAESSLGWPPGSVVTALTKNHAASHETALEDSAVTAPMLAFIQREASWRGTASCLLRLLNEQAGEEGTHGRGWPRTPKNLADLLRRLAPNLRSVGVSIEFSRATDRRRTRLITLNSASAASAASAAEIPVHEVEPQPAAGEQPQFSGLAAELFERAVMENKSLVEQAKAEGDRRSWAAGIREFRTQALQIARGDILPCGSQELTHLKGMNNEQLDEFIEKEVRCFGFRRPEEDEKDAGCGSDGKETAPGNRESD